MNAQEKQIAHKPGPTCLGYSVNYENVSKTV